MGEIFHRAAPASPLAWTGERVTTETTGQVEIEHLHRYFFARSLCRGLDVLDVASGEGYGAALLAQVARSVVGVEVAEDTVEHARAAYDAPGLSFLHGDARRIPCPDQSFDAVVSFETLEHFYEHDEFMAEVRRVLRPGGLLIISSPERDVYSPAGYPPNPYHVHELTHAEFDTLLRANFGHVAMYAQRPLLGSALVAEEVPAGAAPLLTFEKRDAQRFEASVGLPRPIYLMAIASDQPFVPRIGSLYVETSGLEALYDASAAARQEIRSLTERLVEQSEYAQRVQAELNRRDEQLAGQVAEAQDWHRQLVQRNEEQALLNERLVQREAEARSLAQQLERRDAEHDGLVQAHGALLRQQAERYARHEAAYRAESEHQAEQSATREAGLRARLAKAEADLAKWHADALAQQARAEGVEDHLRAVLDSSSWRLTGPVRGIAARHPKAVARAHGFLERHPHVPRAAARFVRGVWRALTLRSVRRPAPPAAAPAAIAAIAPPPPSEPPPEPEPAEPNATPSVAPTAASAAFRHQALLPLAPPPMPALPRGQGRRVLCVGHVWPCPPRAGNEYRVHRMLAWFAQQGWDVLLVVCPLPHEMPSEQQMAGAAAVYPNLLVCDRAGTLHHSLPDGSRLLDGLRLGARTDIPALLQEDDGGDPAQARLLGLLRTFCPDVLVELLLHLRDTFRPDLLLAEYVFMTRPFPLLPGVTTAIDTIDVFSTKAHKVERHGVSDGLALSEVEEAALLRRADILIGIQPDEARDLARLAPGCKVVSVGVDFDVPRDALAAPAGAAAAGAAAAAEAGVLLVASGNPMNAKGLSDFLAVCWPLVCRDVPGAELVVAGAVGDAVQDAVHEGAPGVRVLGRVEDLGPLYAAARVVINPAAAGTGLKIKTVEALCHGRPVVCWPSGADGLSEDARAFCHVAADWPGFAAHLKRLLTHDEDASAVGHARARLEHAFSPGVVYAPLADALHEDAALAYDVFVDLSGTGLDRDAAAQHLRLLKVQCGFAHAAGSMAVLLDGAAATAPALAWSRAVAHAAGRRRHLVVILGPLLPDNGVVQPLLDELGRDPLFGSAQPRFADAATDGVWPLPPAAGPEAGAPTVSRAAQASRAALARLPRGVMTAEWPAALTVIRREVVSAMEPDAQFASVRGAVAHDLCQARRRGFRNAVANRVVVPSVLPPYDLYPALPAEDLARLSALYPDTARAAAENGKLAQRRLEPLLGAAYPASGTRRRLLLNCRGLTTLHNGTSKCVLGMLDGFAALDAPWQVDILADEATTEFHGMAARYPQFNRLSNGVPGGYAAAVMLNQPWSVEAVAEMHRAAFLIGFNILDTIGWDVLFPAPERLEWAWRFVARHSDVLMYISGFSQDRFRARFPVAPGVMEQVVHLSLLTDEHALHRQDLPEGEHVLLFGNSFDHKGIAPTLRLLAEAFPRQAFTVLGGQVGGQGPAVPGVRVVPSGGMAEDEVHRLVATARAVVYPSFYEGFGLPVVESLAYGRPVLARRSPLWAEVAAHSRLPGRLIEFDDPASLIDALGRVLSGSPPPGLLFGAALAEGQAPTGWRDAAAAILHGVEHRLAQGGIGHWQARDEALRTANL